MSSKLHSSALQTGMNNTDNFYNSVDGSSSEYNTLEQHAAPLDLDEKEKQDEAWRTELAKLEEEIHTLKAVLNTKLRESSDLKCKLGITPIVELKQDLQHSISTIKESEPYLKTNAAFKSFGAFASKKLGDFRNSTVFKSVEDRVGGAYSSIKNQLSRSQSSNGSEEAQHNGVDEKRGSSGHQMYT